MAARVGGAAEPAGRIPFQVEDGRIIFPMQVEGSDPKRILLDTGATFEGVYLFHQKAVQELGLEEAAGMDVSGAGPDNPTSSVMKEGVTLSAGGLAFSNQKVLVSLSPRTQGFPRDGVAGGTFFRNYVVEIDQDEAVILLHRKAGFRPDPSYDSIDLTLRKMIPWVDVGIDVAGEGEMVARAYIDTGAGDALLILVRPGMSLPKPEGMERRYIGTGLSGDIYGEFGRVAAVRLGRHRLQSVPAAFPDADTRSRQEGAEAIIGSDLLRRFNVIFDYERGRLYLKPNGSFKHPF